jgi:hypothetical protein
MDDLTVRYQLTVNKTDLTKKAVISFVIAHTAHVLLRVLNSHDEEVRLLLNENINNGEHSVVLDYMLLPSEMYNIKLVVETDKAIDKETQTIQL